MPEQVEQVTPTSAMAAARNYNIDRWGDGFFGVNEKGELVVNAGEQRHSLIDIVEQLVADGQPYPLLLRFSNLLRDRFDRLKHAFDQATQHYDYSGKYTCVYPIKVNQQHSVLNELAQHGQHTFGLESGSKPELLAVLGTPMPSESVVICNGYKDREYIRTALIGQQMGRRVYIVVEKLHELQLVLEQAAELDVEPLLGVRIRMYAVSKGNWQDTGGEKSKFGFSPSQLLKLIEQLKAANKLHCLKLLHCHLGSQISSISDIHRGIKECARYFVELASMGVGIDQVDVGGGLGVDYEGTQSHSFCSINYSVSEYANIIVKTFAEICAQKELPQPGIITESGRALTAHHAVLITNLIDLEPAPGLNAPPQVTSHDHDVLRNLWRHYNDASSSNALEVFHAASFYLNEALSLYTHNNLSLVQWAQVEQLYFATCRKIRPMLDPSIPGHEEVIGQLNTKLADKLFANFSLFQSLPDAWGVEQIFPVVPLKHLDKPLTRRGIVKDITCDSDGRIEQYVNGSSIESSLLLPDIDQHDIVLGIFMVGAYQEILGGLHNLFGDTHAVQINLLANGQYELQEQASGDTVDEVLSVVHFAKSDLLHHYQQQLSASSVNAQRQADYLTELEAGLDGYTYLEE